MSIQTNVKQIGSATVPVSRKRRIDANILETIYEGTDYTTGLIDVLVDMNLYAIARYSKAGAGGFIPRWYTDPKGAGHRQEVLDAMCDEFQKLSRKGGRRHMQKIAQSLITNAGATRSGFGRPGR